MSSWRIENAVDGETSSNKTSCLSLTSCLGNPCVPSFIIPIQFVAAGWNQVLHLSTFNIVEALELGRETFFFLSIGEVSLNDWFKQVSQPVPHKLISPPYYSDITSVSLSLSLFLPPQSPPLVLPLSLSLSPLSPHAQHTKRFHAWINQNVSWVCSAGVKRQQMLKHIELG